MDIPAIILLITGIINLFFGFLIYLKNRRIIVNFIYLLLTVNLTIWAFSIYYFRSAPDTNLFWSKIAYISAAFTALLFFYFSLAFPFKIKIKLFWHIFFSIYFLTLVFLILGSKLILRGYVLVNQTRGLLFGNAYILYGSFIFICFITGFFYLFRKYFSSQGVTKIQAEYVLIGGLLNSFIGIFTNLILFGAGNFKYNWIGPSSALFLVIFLGYAIGKYHLFEIRVILTEFLVVATAITLFIQAFTAETFLLKVLGFLLFIFFLGFGYQLIRSVIREIELRAKLEVLYGELKKLDDAKSEFISIASHQLRTPLTAVKGYVSMILENSYGDIPKEMNQPLKNVYASNERLIGLVNDILNISKIEAGKMEMDLENTSLEEMILDVINELRIKADAKKLYLTFVQPTVAIPLLMVDKTKIRQIIMNLIDNSIKYTEKGGTTIKLLKLDSRLRVNISDTGMGIDKEYIGKLFESFSRANVGARTHPEGTGLGLYIARKYIEMHKGKIWVESLGKGKGSTFYIELPIK